MTHIDTFDTFNTFGIILTPMSKTSSTEKLIIIGSGPAGLTAAIYASRGGLNPLVVAGRLTGGQLMLTTDVDDFPGFEDGIQGPDLMSKMRKQAERFDTRFINEDVTAVDLKQKPFSIVTESRNLKADSLIIATGASATWLGIPSEEKFIGRGVSACAVCDGLFFKGKDIIVVGGGDTAMREAQHLSKICKTVTIVHRRSELRAQEALQSLVRSKENVKFVWDCVIEEFLGDQQLSAVKLKNLKTQQLTDLPIAGVFVAIGHKPNTDFLKGQLDLDDHGYIKVTNETQTSVPGVYFAGDVADKEYKQAVTAAGMGTKAALDVEKYLEHSS